MDEGIDSLRDTRFFLILDAYSEYRQVVIDNWVRKNSSYTNHHGL